MLDGIKLEKAGVPTVAIVTAPFVATAQAMARSWGVAEYKFLVMPHPIANLSEAELDTRADELTTQVMAFLTGDQGKP